MNKLAKVLDTESYEWLFSNHPTLADAVEAEVNAGATPESIRRFVLRHTGGRLEIAYRCEAAARFLVSKQAAPGEADWQMANRVARE